MTTVRGARHRRHHRRRQWSDRLGGASTLTRICHPYPTTAPHVRYYTIAKVISPNHRRRFQQHTAFQYSLYNSLFKKTLTMMIIDS